MNRIMPTLRRWWQFDLRTLLLLTTIAGLGFGWWSDHRRQEQRIQAIHASMYRTGWNAKSLLGAPDTPGSGDLVTAWASSTPDGQDEWIDLEYSRAVLPDTIEIHETYNPGAVSKVSCFTTRGEEVVVWQANAVARTAEPRRVLKVPVNKPFRTRRIKVYIDSTKVYGWNEIDAVGLFDKQGQMQWVTRARTSTSFSTPSDSGGVGLLWP